MTEENDLLRFIARTVNSLAGECQVSAEVPAAWRAQVEAHVRCCFLVRGEARYRREVVASQGRRK